jgi:hypothetical protein
MVRSLASMFAGAQIRMRGTPRLRAASLFIDRVPAGLPLPTPGVASRIAMTLCPIALAVGCRRCAIVAHCPVKTVIGDFDKKAPAKPAVAKPKKT